MHIYGGGRWRCMFQLINLSLTRLTNGSWSQVTSFVKCVNITERGNSLHVADLEKQASWEKLHELVFLVSPTVCISI